MPISLGVILMITAVFLLEGAIIGKFIPTTAVFPAIVVYFGSELYTTLVLVHLAALAATVGQYFIFVSVRNASTSECSYGFIDKYVYNSRFYPTIRRYFKKVTPSSVLITNSLPGIRGLLIVPLSTTDYSELRMLGAAYVGNAIHFGGATLLFVGGLSIL